MAKSWLPNGPCTKCNFMRRTDSNGYCPNHRPPEKVKERLDWYKTQFPGRKFDVSLLTHDWGEEEYVLVLAVNEDVSIKLLRPNGKFYFTTPRQIDKHIGPKATCKTTWPISHRK